MLVLAHRLVRGVVLGLMCFLAAAAGCSCDSYDPDPYDSAPPVVTVDFNYVIPSGVTLRRPGAHVKFPQQALFSSHRSSVTAPSVLAFSSPVISTVGKETSRLIMPLRC